MDAETFGRLFPRNTDVKMRLSSWCNPSNGKLGYRAEVYKHICRQDGSLSHTLFLATGCAMSVSTAVAKAVKAYQAYQTAEGGQ